MLFSQTESYSMNDPMTPGRQLLMEVLDTPEIAAGIAADADLILAGINSGDLIRLGLSIEEKTALPLSDDDLIELQTVGGIDRVLANRTQE
jgi:acyl carrier protein